MRFPERASKGKGVPVMDIFCLQAEHHVYEHESVHDAETGSCREPYSKNTLYQFLNSVKTNRLRFASFPASAVINKTVKGLTSERHADVFIIDDSMYERSGYKSFIVS